MDVDKKVAYLFDFEGIYLLFLISSRNSMRAL